MDSVWSGYHLMGSGMTSWINLKLHNSAHSRQDVWKITLSEFRDFLIKSNPKLFFMPGIQISLLLG